MAACGAYNPLTGQVLSCIAPKIRAAQFAAVLEKLAARARRTGRLIVVVLDNANLHKGKLARAAWARYALWLKPYWLPAYCPDLNDIERVWKREKELHFANTLPPSFEAFERKVRARFRSLAHVQCRARGRRSGRVLSLSRILKDLLPAA